MGLYLDLSRLEYDREYYLDTCDFMVMGMSEEKVQLKMIRPMQY